MDIICLSFIFIFSLFIIHEMDAIRTKEWKMFIFLKDMKDETAYKIFSLIHLPLYILLVYFVLQARINGYLLPYIIIDILLIAHNIVHFAFRNNMNNGFVSLYSRIIINLLGTSALIHLVMLYILKF